MEKKNLKGQGTAYKELCRFTDSCDLVIELEKPFTEFENLFLRIRDKEGEEIRKVTLPDISVLEKESAKLLNELSKTK